MKQTSIKYGIITGAAMVLYLFLFYTVDKASMLNPLVYWSSLLFPMVGMVIATRKFRDIQDGEISKKEAIQVSFFTWILAMVIFHLFLYVMFNFVDNGLIDLQKELIEKANGQVIKREDLQMTFGAVFFRMAFMFIPGFLFSYMIASFLSNK